MEVTFSKEELLAELRLSKEELLNEFLPSFQNAFKPVFLGSIYDWAKEEVVLSGVYNPSGPFDVQNSRYLIEPFNALRDPKIRQVNVMASPRSGKTLLAEIFLLHTIPNNPGTLLWLQSGEDQMDKMGDLRMVQLLKSCKPVYDLIDKNNRFAITQKKWAFAHGMTVHFGSAKLSNLQNVGYRYLIGDEVWQWKPGYIDEAKARVGDFYDISKTFFFSQGGEHGDSWSTEFNRASVYEWGWKCPKCAASQIYYWNEERSDGSRAGIQWEKNEKTYVNKQWVIEEAAKTARLECINVNCKHRIEDTDANRHLLNKTGEYVCIKKDGDSDKRSYRWNALANRKVKFSTLVEEFLYADFVKEQFGNVEPKKVFYQKRLARSWGEKWEKTKIELALDEYDENQEWKDEKHRFLTVDVQEKSPRFWWLIRAWAANGDSRLIKYGYCETWKELNEIRLKYNVREQRVFVDAGHDSTDVYTGCASQWRKTVINKKNVTVCYNAAHGQGVQGFYNTKDKTWRWYKEPELKPAKIGDDPNYKGPKGCPFYSWANTPVKKVLEHLRDGKGSKWLANNVCDTYKKQMYSEECVINSKNSKKTPIYIKVSENARNEYWDLEALQVLAADISGILQVQINTKEQPPTTNN